MTTLGQLWYYFEITLGQLWDNFETTLRQLWNNFGSWSTSAQRETPDTDKQGENRLSSWRFSIFVIIVNICDDCLLFDKDSYQCKIKLNNRWRPARLRYRQFLEAVISKYMPFENWQSGIKIQKQYLNNTIWLGGKLRQGSFSLDLHRLVTSAPVENGSGQMVVRMIVFF